MARIHRYTKGKVTLSDTLVGTDVENQKATVNIPIAAIVDIAIDYFNVNGNGDGINQSLLDITTSLDGNTTAIASYQNIVNTLTTEFESVVTRTETLESIFNTNVDGTLTLSTANITNFAETIASEGFASATTVDSLSSQVQQIVDGVLTIDTYATIDQLANTTSTLTGSIATLEDTLTTAYRAYTDGILTTDAFASAVSGLVTESTDTFASSTEYTNLKSSFGTFNSDGTLNTLSDAFANNVLSTYTGPDLATAQSVTDLGAEFGTFDANGNLTGLSSALASEITTAVAGEGYATTTQVSNLESTLRQYVDGEIASSSTAGITGSQLTTVLADYAEATDLTELQASIGTFDANGNITGLSTAFATQVTSAVATDTFAQVTDLDELKAEIGTFDADGNLTGLSTAFSTELTDIIATENLASAQSVTDLTATVTQNNTTLSAGVSTNQSAIAEVDGKLAASYGLNVTAGNAIAGMTFLADGETDLSEIKFVANTFKIDRPGGAISPFIVNADGTISLNGQVTFSSASTGEGIDYTGLAQYLQEYNYATTSDLPDEFTTADVQSYLDAQGYVAGQNSLDDAQIATYLSDNNYVTTTTTINGGQIQTGIIASGDYADSTPNDGFSDTGMAINLDAGSIHSEQFYINPDGSANFGGTHSAGSIGSWTVDSSGALKDGSSEIVLDPSGNYTEVGTEKLVLSSENLPAISPSAAVSANFSFSPNTFASPFGTTSASNNFRLTSRSGGVTAQSGVKNVKYYFPDITGDLVGTNVRNNIAYDAYTGGTATYSIPYGEGPGNSNQQGDSFRIVIGLQEEFGKDYGWGSITADSGPNRGDGDLGSGEEPSEINDGSGSLDFSSIPNIADVAGFDYELKVKFTFTFIPDSGGLVPILATEEKVLATGAITKNLNEATGGIMYPDPGTNDANAKQFFGWFCDVPGTWPAGQIDGSFSPPSNRPNMGTASDPGEIAVTAQYFYEITDIYVWSANSTTTGYRLNEDQYPWAYMDVTGRNYLSSGEDLTNSFSNVLFTGASGKTNIGLNGIQVRGNKGFVALGDVVPGSANAVAQVWGNAQVFGTLTSNVTRTFSDKNLKDNITPISNALDTVSKLEPVSFNWKPDMRGIDLETRYGFIAQDMQDVLPTIVKEGEHLTLEHNNIISINTAAIKELVSEINELKEEIKTLKQNNG